MAALCIAVVLLLLYASQSSNYCTQAAGSCRWRGGKLVVDTSDFPFRNQPECSIDHFEPTSLSLIFGGSIMSRTIEHGQHQESARRRARCFGQTEATFSWIHCSNITEPTWSVLVLQPGPMENPEVREPGEGMGRKKQPEVSIILPVYNAEAWLDECLESVAQQDFDGCLEVSIYNDASKDGTAPKIEDWRDRLEKQGIAVIVGSHSSTQPRGVGCAKNRAILQSCGRYLCFLDSDDVMMPQRIRMQYEAALQRPQSIIGCQVRRIPEGATERYTRWINNLTQEQLLTQVYTSHGPTVIMPTWFCSREWFCHVGQFVEDGKGSPEDLLFFYEHLRKGGGAYRVDKGLLLYRYHEQAATHSVSEETIWVHRVRFLEEKVLAHWPSFTIWNAGKQGRKLYRSLTEANRQKVVAFCDVDSNKISKGCYTYEESKERPKPRIPVIHFQDAKAPFVVCVKLDLTGGGFEENLKSLDLTEGEDFYHFN